MYMWKLCKSPREDGTREGDCYTSCSRSGLCLCDAVFCYLECKGIASGISEQWGEFNPLTHVLKSVHSPGEQVLMQSSWGICINTPVFACWILLLFSFLYLAYLPPAPDESYFSPWGCPGCHRGWWWESTVSWMEGVRGWSLRKVGSWGSLMMVL